MGEAILLTMTGRLMMECGPMDCAKAMESTPCRTGSCMMVNGLMIKNMEKEVSSVQMELQSKPLGSLTK